MEHFKLFMGILLEEYICRTFFAKEPETLERINRGFKNNETFYDIGANIGVYSLFTASLYSKMRIYGFEPYFLNYVRFYENIKLNNFSNMIPLFIGLSDKSGIEALYVSDNRIGASGSQIGKNVDEHNQSYEPLSEEYVPTFSLDHFIETFQSPIPNHIKIDVDGIESRIICGMANTLNRPEIKSVLVEVNLGSNNYNEIVRTFYSNGFKEDKDLNSLPNHSRYRRKGTVSEQAENIIFVR